jgi:integrase
MQGCFAALCMTVWRFRGSDDDVNRHEKIFDKRLSDKRVALVVKRLTAGEGIEGDFAGHSLRAGLTTAAAAAGVPERAIMIQTGHKSLATVRKYIRDGSLFVENAAARVGL